MGKYVEKYDWLYYVDEEAGISRKVTRGKRLDEWKAKKEEEGMVFEGSTLREASMGTARSKDFSLLKAGMRIKTNANMFEVGKEFEGTVISADEVSIFIKRDDGKKSSVTKGDWFISPMFPHKDAWWETGAPAKCSACGKRSEHSMMVADGVVCKECYDKMPKCKKCGKVHVKVEASSPKVINEKLYEFRIKGKNVTLCGKCFKHEYETCEKCHEIEVRSEMTLWYSSRICKTCAAGKVVKCVGCGESIPKEGAFRTKDGRPYCGNCSRNMRLNVQPLVANRYKLGKIKNAVLQAPKNNKEKEYKFRPDERH